MALKSQYTLSSTLHGHESDVKSLVFPTPGTIASASRDGSSRLWKNEGKDTDGTILWPSQVLYHETPYVNSITWLNSEDQSTYFAIASTLLRILIIINRPSCFRGSEGFNICQFAT